MPEYRSNQSRRSLLQAGWRTLALAGLTRGIGQGAQRTDGVLVCLHLTGGNDGNNLIVPLDAAQYQAYADLRGALALGAGDVLPVPGTRNPGRFGFHPALSELRDLYNQGVLAVMANTGPARRPQAGHRYESMAFLKGGYMIPGFAALQAGLDVKSSGGFATAPHGVSVVALDGRGVPETVAAHSIETQFPDSTMGRTLGQVAAMLPSTMGRRMLFTVAMHGFDTHRDQLARQAALFRELSQAMGAFFAATVESGNAQRVTVFTESEFGRSLRGNAAGGSEHGWGNHQLVMGGSVLGGDIHGVFPDLTSVSADGMVSGDGILEPATSRDSYLAALAGWSGMNSDAVTRVLPGAGAGPGPGLMS